VTSYASLDCRLDGTPGSCPLLLGEFQLTGAGPHTFEVRAIDAAGNISVATKSWTTICNPPSTGQALALLHLDETSGQTLVNPVGVAAIRGDTTAAEPSDPTLVASRSRRASA
jgi:hypothetical protein